MLYLCVYILLNSLLSFFVGVGFCDLCFYSFEDDITAATPVQGRKQTIKLG